MDARLHEFTERLDRTNTQGALSALLADTATTCGYRSLGFILPDVPMGDLPFHVSNHPRDLTEPFAAALYTCAPFVRQARHSFMPFIWGTAGDDWSLGPDEQRLAEKARAAGTPKALFVPVHGPHSRFGMLVAASQAADDSFHAQNRRHTPFLRLAAIHLHDHALRRFVAGEEKADLTRREREVLGHFAIGGTAAQVAAKLGISPRTVTFHMENAKRKLGAPTIAGAVARALSGGFLAA